MANNSDIDDFFSNSYTEYKDYEESVESNNSNNEKGVVPGGNNRHYSSSNFSSNSNEAKPIYGLIAVAIIAIALIFILSVFIKSNKLVGIEADGETVLIGYSYSDLEYMVFRVKNKGRRDSSADTTWELNGNVIVQGTNSALLNMEYMQWGVNFLTAKNNNDEVKFTIEMLKSVTASSGETSALTMMLGYPDEFYKPIIYDNIKYDRQLIEEIAEKSSSSIKYSDGGIVTTQKLTDDIALETLEYGGYNLGINHIIGLPSVLTKYSKTIEVTGNWDDVINAKIIVYSEFEYNNPIVYRMYAGDIVEVNTDNVVSYTDHAEISIGNNGIYIIRPNNRPLNTLQIDYTIGVIKVTDDIDFNAVLEEHQIDTSLEGLESTPYMADLIDYDTKEFIKKLSTDAAREGVETVYNIYSFGYMTPDRPLLDVINEHYINPKSLYNQKAVIVIDCREASFSKLSELSKILSGASYLYDDMYFVVFTSTVKNFKSFEYWSENIKFVECDGPEYITDKDIEYINSGIDLGMLVSNSGYTEIIKDSNVMKLADSKFNINRDTLNSKCTFNNELQGGDSFGYCSFAYLVYTKNFNKNFVNDSTLIIPDFTVKKKDETITDSSINNSFIDELLLSDSRLYSNISDSQVEQLLESGLSIYDSIDSSIINILTLSQLNETKENLIRPNAIKQDGSGNYFITIICEKLAKGEPVFANLESSYGSTTVLITSVDYDLDKEIYILNYYNPLEATKQGFATMTFDRAVSNNTIFYDYTFDSDSEEVYYHDIALIDSITYNLSDGSAWYYSLEY